MVNLTRNGIVFHQSEQDLHQSILRALRKASKWILDANGLKGLKLETVTTATKNMAAFPAYVKSCILADSERVFGVEYIQDALRFLSAEGVSRRDLYERLTFAPANGPRAFKLAFCTPLKQGFGAMLVALHCKGVITLPYSFRWPIGYVLAKKGKVVGRRELCNVDDLPELLAFMRSLQSQAEQQDDPVFGNLTKKQRERFFSMGGRAIVAMGWKRVKDANYGDMLELKRANDATSFSGQENLALIMLVDVLQRKFGSRCPITAKGWHDRASLRRKPTKSSSVIALKAGEDSYLAQALEMRASYMRPSNLASLIELPAIDFCVPTSSKVWLLLQTGYLRKVKRESDKQTLQALGYLNAYLFWYLPYWYAEHPDFGIEFPSTPNKLIAGVFVCDLGLYEAKEKPISFVAFLDAKAKRRQWGAHSHYAVLKQVERFFDFVERIQDLSDDTRGFRQPLQALDYPRVSRPLGTSKRPVPRRIFRLYLDYIEALCAYLEVVQERLITSHGHADIGLHNRMKVIDTFCTSKDVGFIPLVFRHGKAVPLRFIPNVLGIEKRMIKGIGEIPFPHPHALYQILVSLFTGLRQQHIQWLDVLSFDKDVEQETNVEFTRLHVNTDKVKVVPWSPFVNFRVIEILRKQKAWREMIDEPGFANRVYYNLNPNTKWPEILCLFAYSGNGAPHSDATYGTAWDRILAGVQGLLTDVGEPNLQLMRLLPPSVPIDAPDILERLHQYGMSEERKCDLVVKSHITPHSARVSVVSHLITVLPAELIGRELTGQTEATVYHYAVLDEDEIETMQQVQGSRMKKEDGKSEFMSLLKTAGHSSGYVRADEPSSSLSMSLRSDLDQTLEAFGCVSISAGNDGKSGLDVLRETRAIGASENKTEICPFGNHCPNEVVKQLGSFRRCGPCHYAVRSIDHLPAIMVKLRQVSENLTELNSKLAIPKFEEQFTDCELDEIESQRSNLAEDLAAWQLSAEVLEMMRLRLMNGDSRKRWHVQKPEVIARHLQRAKYPTNTSAYVLARLAESEAFPSLESPSMRSRFELFRRRLLASTGNLQEALSLHPSIDPAAECRGLICSIVEAHGLSISDVQNILEQDEFALPAATPKLISYELLT